MEILDLTLEPEYAIEMVRLPVETATGVMEGRVTEIRFQGRKFHATDKSYHFLDLETGEIVLVVTDISPPVKRQMESRLNTHIQIMVKFIVGLSVGFILGPLIISLYEAYKYDVSLYDAVFIESWKSKEIK